MINKDDSLRLLKMHISVRIHKFGYCFERGVIEWYLELILSFFWFELWFIQPITQSDT